MGRLGETSGKAILETVRWSVTEAAIGQRRGDTDHARESFTLDFKQTLLWKLKKQSKKTHLVKELNS